MKAFGPHILIMPFQRAGQLARETPVARPGDPLGLVAENLRESHYGAIPVVEGGYDSEGKLSANARVIGIVFEADLTNSVLPILEQREEARLSGAPFGSGATAPATDPLPTPGGSQAPPVGLNGHGLNGHANGFLNGFPTSAGLRDVENLKASDVMQHHVPVVPSLFSLHNALLTLERYGAPALPVVDESGGYRGMISRADVVAALGSYVRPPVVGGMATPLGVWLTTGHIKAGAPPLGLFLSGALMGLIFMLSHYIMLFTLSAINPVWGAMFQSGRIGAGADNANSFNFIVTMAEGLLFLLLIRLTPLAGIHAAEHQTVWAIERGVPLEPEYVKQMPRAHPRCGTNLMVLAALIQIVFGHLPDTSPFMVLTSLLFIYFAWRSLGTAVQTHFTTRPATLKQLESGIRAGKGILEQYQEQPHALTSFGSRLFNSGLLLSAAGMILILFLFNWLESAAAGFALGG